MVRHSFIVAGVEGKEGQSVNLLEGEFESIKITCSWTSCINLGAMFPRERRLHVAHLGIQHPRIQVRHYINFIQLSAGLGLSSQNLLQKHPRLATHIFLLYKIHGDKSNERPLKTRDLIPRTGLSKTTLNGEPRQGEAKITFKHSRH